MEKTSVVDPRVKDDTHGIDTMPSGTVVRVVKGDDGTVELTRENDGASWDGAAFVVPEPPMQTYTVTVLIEAKDDPTARTLIADALIAATVTAEVMPLADLVRDE